MPVIVVGHHPELTAEGAMKVVEGHFVGKYEVYKTKRRAHDFIVKQSAWRGVGIKLRQKRGQTAFAVSGMTPSTVATMAYLLPAGVWFALGMGALGSGEAGGAGGCLGFLLWLALGAWILSFVSSRPSKGLMNETRAFIQSAEEFN